MSDRGPHFDVRQEDDEVAARRLVRIAVLGVVTGVTGVLCAGFVVVHSAGTLRPSFAGASGPAQAPPRGPSNVEQTPLRDSERGADVRNAQLRELQSWGWIDREAGIAVIPIDEAMDLVVGQESR